MNTELYDVGFWAGTEASLSAYLCALKKLDESGHAKAGVYGSTEETPKREPRLFSKQGDIGVISIAGSLTNSSSWYNEFIGVVGYGEIREALIHAAQQTDVKAIVLDIKSGGGAVSGVSDTGELIAMVNKEVKPVHAYSDGMIASAAYWLGASAQSVTIGKVTEAGSIGVLVMQQEMSKMLANEGITVNVIRSGKWKALGNSAEPLSELGRETLQAQVDTLNDMFVAHVAQARGTTATLVEQNMGQGRVFIGQEAVDVGLVDAVSNFDAFMTKVQGEIDFQKPQSKYGANLSKGPISMKQALTAQQIAALAAGAAAASTDAPAVAEVVVEVVADAPVVEDTVLTATLEVTADTGVVQLLQTQLAAAQASVLTLTVEAAASKAALATAEASTVSAKAVADLMRPVVRASLGNLRVALNGSKAGVEALNDEALIAEHTSLAADFGQKFKAGGVAAVSPADAVKADDAVDHKHRARIAATSSNTNKKQ